MPGCTWSRENPEEEEVVVLTVSYTIFRPIPRLSAMPLTSTFFLEILFPGNKGETEIGGKPMIFEIVAAEFYT